MLISIESSCDDSSLALTRISDCALLYHKKISQEKAHNKYGGVVPEIASRLHTASLPLILSDIKAFLGDFREIKAVCVTSEPGLSVSLIEGMMMAKTLSLSLKIPLICINHLIGHYYSLFINNPSPIFPASIILVSGGHTMILEATDSRHFKIIGESIDDSFGECFDKVAKMLGLSYPGGEPIQTLANNYLDSFNINKEIKNILFPLPLPLKDSKDICFSFSGLKNATRLLIEKELDANNIHSKQHIVGKICASFQEAMIAHICDKLLRYVRANKHIKHLAIVGGASANLRLREKISQICKTYNIELMLSSLEFCADNAAMIGRAGVVEFNEKNFSNLLTQDISPKSTTPLIYR